MTDLQISKRYAVVTAITMVALMLVSFALSVFVGYDMGGGVGIVSVIVPAMEAGSNYVREVGATPDKRRMWRLSFLFTLINLAMGVVIFAGFLIVSGIGLAALFGEIGASAMMGILVVVFGLYILVGRFFLGLGARQEARRQEKQRR